MASGDCFGLGAHSHMLKHQQLGPDAPVANPVPKGIFQM